MHKRYTDEFKAQLVQAMLKEEKTVSQLAAEHGIHPNQLYQWRNIALAGLPSLFSGQAVQELAAREAAHAAELERLYAEIGRLSTELAWLKKIWSAQCLAGSASAWWKVLALFYL